MSIQLFVKVFNEIELIKNFAYVYIGGQEVAESALTSAVFSICRAYEMWMARTRPTRLDMVEV
jgi:hypothetical protein